MHSLLFYGPPGTGKTSFQEWVAADLEWPLLVITVGDFLSEGEGNVGKKAVEIFRQLDYMSNTCIVFDEFDELVVDRNPRGDHGALRGAPALLTPTMLPLLAELRKRSEEQCCLVSFTTNYIASIDFAARRVGRVDREILLVYPDFESRLMLAIDNAGSGLTSDDIVEMVSHPDFVIRLANAILSVESSVGYSELLEIAERVSLCGLGTAMNHIADQMKDRRLSSESPVPAISPDYYPSPLVPNRYLANEIVGLINAVGPKPMIERFLDSERGRSWRPLYVQAAAAQDLLSGRLAQVTVVLQNVPMPPEAHEPRVILLGRGSVLGNWSIENGMPLTEATGNEWRRTMTLPIGAELEFKFLLRPAPATPWRWEGDPNRKYIVPTSPPPEICFEWRP